MMFDQTRESRRKRKELGETSGDGADGASAVGGVGLWLESKKELWADLSASAVGASSFPRQGLAHHSSHQPQTPGLLLSQWSNRLKRFSSQTIEVAVLVESWRK